MTAVATSSAAEYAERARSLGTEHRPPDAILLGRHLVQLGMEPGPRMGEVLKAVYEQQLDGKVTTIEEATALARQLIDFGSA